MYEMEMKYCPACEDEYRPDMSRCGVCGTPLITGTEMSRQKQARDQDVASRKGALKGNDILVTIFSAPMADVKRINQKLLAVNIGTLIVGQGGACGKGCRAPEVELQVRREDAAAAAQIIKRDFEEMTKSADFVSEYQDLGFDPSAAESSCPACGCTFSTKNSVCPDCGLCFG